MTEPLVPVGFDYAKAMIEISRRLTYWQIAEYCGYEGKQSVLDVIQGHIPSHPQGEAIWALYVELFGHKPPHSPAQAAGGAKVRLIGRQKQA